VRKFKIGMMNLGYNIRRLVRLERMAAARVESMWHRAKDAAVAGQVQKRSPIADSPRHARGNRSLGEDRNRRKPVLFEVSNSQIDLSLLKIQFGAIEGRGQAAVRLADLMRLDAHAGGAAPTSFCPACGATGRRRQPQRRRSLRR
jgi:hypothetical protein